MTRTLLLLYSMLTHQQRRQLIWLQVLIGIVAVIQVAGVVSIAPYVALLSNPGLIQSNRYIRAAYAWSGSSNTIDFLTAMAIALVFAILISNALTALCTWLITRYSIAVGQGLQRDVYRHHLHKDYALYAQKNSAAILAQISQECPRLAFMVLMPALSLVSQAFVVLIIAGTLLYLNWAAAIAAVALIGGGYVLVYTFIQKALIKFGHLVYRTGEERQKQLSESVAGIKEIKLLGTESLYEERLAKINSDGLEATAAITMLGDIPRYVLETIALAALLGFATYVLRSQGATEKIVGMLSLYAMAAYKLLPSAQSLFKCISLIRANGDVVHSVLPSVMAGRAISEAESSNQAQGQQTDSRIPPGDIRLCEINYRYPEAATPTLTGIDFTVPRNSLVALVGASGAGKSTIADIVLGLLPPDSGVLCVGETEITSHNVRAWQRQIGYVPQTIFIVDDSVAANIAFGVPSPNLQAVTNAARLANIDSYIASLPDRYDFRVGERGALLSGGQRQRLGIARALYRNPQVLVMDEATSALDAVTEHEIMETLLRLKLEKTIIMVAHRLSTIEAADSVVLVDKGRILDVGTCRDLRDRSPIFRRIVLASKGERSKTMPDADLAPSET